MIIRMSTLIVHQRMFHKRFLMERFFYEPPRHFHAEPHAG